MKPKQRQERILGLLNEQERAEVEELAGFFDVSPETIRRDLAALSEQGLLRKVHGGAVKFQTAQENAFAFRIHQNHPQKLAIGRYAAQLLEPGDSVFIDTGSTTLVFAQQLAELSDLTVITNSLVVANELWNGSGKNNVYLLGGAFNGEASETLGTMVIDQINQFQADHAFLTIGAVSATYGFMDFNSDEAHVARAMIAQARQITILADSSKLNKTALVKVCDFSQVHRLVVDRMPGGNMAQVLEQEGVNVHVSEVDLRSS